MPVTIRAATTEDAEAVTALGHEFVTYLRALGDPNPQSLSAAAYLQDGFGDRPTFSGLVAEMDGQVVGYLLYCWAYDLDLGDRIVYLIDLFVHEATRRQGYQARIGTSYLVGKPFPMGAAAQPPPSRRAQI